jgi:hypothetical protein
VNGVGDPEVAARVESDSEGHDAGLWRRPASAKEGQIADHQGADQQTDNDRRQHQGH